MTSTTKKNATRKEVRASIKDFARQMSEAPAAPAKKGLPALPECVFSMPDNIKAVMAMQAAMMGR